jgi:hypothetical protein
MEANARTFGGRLLSHDAEAQSTELFHFDESTGKAVIENRQNVESLIETNKAIRNESAGHRFGDGKRVASIPMNVYMDLMQRGILADRKKFKAWLNDPDNEAWRVFPGRV